MAIMAGNAMSVLSELHYRRKQWLVLVKTSHFFQLIKGHVPNPLMGRK